VIALGSAGPTAVGGVIEVAGITTGDTVVVHESESVGIASAVFAWVPRVILVGGPSGRLQLARENGLATPTSTSLSFLMLENECV